MVRALRGAAPGSSRVPKYGGIGRQRLGLPAGPAGRPWRPERTSLFHARVSRGYSAVLGRHSSHAKLDVLAINQTALRTYR
jgi:hypothetical protein